MATSNEGNIQEVINKLLEIIDNTDDPLLIERIGKVVMELKGIQRIWYKL